VVDGRVIESDGKTENAQHVLALAPFTLAVLRAHAELLGQERREIGPDYRGDITGAAPPARGGARVS
jgi:hypothetical protein